MIDHSKTFYVRLAVLLILVSAIQGCGKSSDSKNKALPDVMAPADSPDLRFSTKSTTESRELEGQNQQVENEIDEVNPQSELATAGLKFARDLKIPLYADFPSLASVDKGKASWFVGSRCNLLLSKMKKIKSRAPNLIHLVDPNICSNPLIGDKALITLVPSRYIGRHTSRVGVLLTESSSVDVILRKDLSVGAYRESTSLGERRNSTTVVAKDGFVTEMKESPLAVELKVRSYDSRLSYFSSSPHNTPKAANQRFAKTLEYKNFRGFTLLMTEATSLNDRKMSTSRCVVTVIDKSKLVVSRLDLNERCFHTFM